MTDGIQDKKSHYHGLTRTNLAEVNHSYGARYGTSPIPKYHIASKVRVFSRVAYKTRCLSNIVVSGNQRRRGVSGHSR
jgi:hypothetical protein